MYARAYYRRVEKTIACMAPRKNIYGFQRQHSVLDDMYESELGNTTLVATVFISLSLLVS